ncbi:hypothetical protein [Caulobacter endophyticus]|nr:hypothetical protein [Caulobacter endophyticus]MDG2531983.1 hypothetical protein [Caulobacter endophyticus]
MNVTKMSRAMLSFALMGGLLVGPRPGVAKTHQPSQPPKTSDKK